MGKKRSVVLNNDERKAILKLIDDRLSYLQDNAYRHRCSGDRYGELEEHERDIEKWRVIRAKISEDESL